MSWSSVGLWDLCISLFQKIIYLKDSGRKVHSQGKELILFILQVVSVSLLPGFLRGVILDSAIPNKIKHYVTFNKFTDFSEFENFKNHLS